MKRYFIIIILMVLTDFFITSCDQGPPPAFTSQERELIDTLYLRRVSVLRPQLDSTCEANFNTNVIKIADSLINVRKQEEAALRARALGQ